MEVAARLPTVDDGSTGFRAWYTYGASVQDGLEQGYKFGFTAGLDNHTAGPGNSFFYYENASRIPSDSVFLTGIWTDRVDRGSVFDALYARHTWAVWDTRAIVYFTVNAAPAGYLRSLELAEAAGEKFALPRLGLARLRLVEGRLTDAVDLSTQAAALAPKDPANHIILAKAYEALGRPVQATREWEQAASLLPTDPVPYYHLFRTKGQGGPVTPKI